MQQERCIQAVFAHKSILIVRARSLHLFPQPELQSTDSPAPRYGPIARHSYQVGWNGGVSVTTTASPTLTYELPGQPLPLRELSILIRADDNDPWSSVRTLDLYVLGCNPVFANTPSLAPSMDDLPYLFPPTLRTQVPSCRGSLRCADVILGQFGTAVWIHPRDRANMGLIHADLDYVRDPVAEERLAGAVFPGPLRSNLGLDDQAIEARTLITNPRNDWTAVEYDEVMGRIALGSSCGRVTLVNI